MPDSPNSRTRTRWRSSEARRGRGSENYSYAAWPRDNDTEHREKIILPADYRTSAQNQGNDAYVYWGDGGFSWAIPYFAGLAALAWGVDGNLTIEDVYRRIDETKTRTSQGRYVINPEAFIERVSEKRGNDPEM